MYLEQRAAEDELFAERYRNPNKDMDGCVTYILNWVKNSGCNGFPTVRFTDKPCIFGMKMKSKSVSR